MVRLEMADNKFTHVIFVTFCYVMNVTWSPDIVLNWWDCRSITYLLSEVISVGMPWVIIIKPLMPVLTENKHKVQKLQAPHSSNVTDICILSNVADTKMLMFYLYNIPSYILFIRNWELIQINNTHSPLLGHKVSFEYTNSFFNMSYFWLLNKHLYWFWDDRIPFCILVRHILQNTFCIFPPWQQQSCPLT